MREFLSQNRPILPLLLLVALGIAACSHRSVIVPDQCTAQERNDLEVLCLSQGWFWEFTVYNEDTCHIECSPLDVETTTYGCVLLDLGLCIDMPVEYGWSSLSAATLCANLRDNDGYDTLLLSGGEGCARQAIAAGCFLDNYFFNYYTSHWTRSDALRNCAYADGDPR